MKQLYYTLIAGLCIVTSLAPMGKEEKDLAKNGPVHIELQGDQGVYHGVIVNKKDLHTNHQAITPGTRLSFNGYTTIDGIRRENDDSTGRIKLADITKLYVTDPTYSSKRYPSKEYALVDVVTRGNQHVKQLLFPRLLIVCTEELPSKLEKSWFIRDLESIEVLHGSTPEQVVEKAKDTNMVTHFLEPLGEFLKHGGL